MVNIWERLRCVWQVILFLTMYTGIVIRIGSKPTQVRAGFVLHYHIYDAEDFIKKFTNFSNRPNTYLSGNRVKGLKLLLRDIVNSSGMNKGELAAYFKNNLQFSTREVARLKKNRYLLFFKRTPAPLEIVTAVQQVFESKIDTT